MRCFRAGSIRLIGCGLCPPPQKAWESLADGISWKKDKGLKATALWACHPVTVTLSHQPCWDLGQRRASPGEASGMHSPVWSSGSLFSPLHGEMELKWNVNDEQFHFLTWGKWRCWWICVIVTFYKHRECKSISCLPARQQCSVVPVPGSIVGKGKSRQISFLENWQGPKWHQPRVMWQP